MRNLLSVASREPQASWEAPRSFPGKESNTESFLWSLPAASGLLSGNREALESRFLTESFTWGALRSLPDPSGKPGSSREQISYELNYPGSSLEPPGSLRQAGRLREQISC